MNPTKNAQARTKSSIYLCWGNHIKSGFEISSDSEDRKLNLICNLCHALLTPSVAWKWDSINVMEWHLHSSVSVSHAGHLSCDLHPYSAIMCAKVYRQLQICNLNTYFLNILTNYDIFIFFKSNFIILKLSYYFITKLFHLLLYYFLILVYYCIYL